MQETITVNFQNQTVVTAEFWAEFSFEQNNIQNSFAPLDDGWVS